MTDPCRRNHPLAAHSGSGYCVDGSHHAPRDAVMATGALGLLIAITRSVMTTMMALLAAHRGIWWMSNVPKSLPRRAYEHEAASVHPAVPELHHIVEQHHVADDLALGQQHRHVALVDERHLAAGGDRPPARAGGDEGDQRYLAREALLFLHRDVQGRQPPDFRVHGTLISADPEAEHAA